MTAVERTYDQQVRLAAPSVAWFALPRSPTAGHPEVDNVPLTEKHRNEIYRHLAPQWGEEVTQAFLSQFPARDRDEPVTRDFVRAELAELRGELHQLGSRLAGLVVAVTGILIAAMGIVATVVVALT
jgi:hypothetical protein